MGETRLPPSNRDAERAVLGSMLRDNRTIDDVFEILTADDFYPDAHRKIFSAVFELHAEGKGADLVTVADRLKDHRLLEDLGGQAYGYLAELWDAAPSTGNVVHYATAVKDASIRRALLRVAEGIERGAWSPTGPATDAVETAEREIFAIAESAIDGEDADAPQVVAELFDFVDRCQKRDGTANGVRTGFSDLDRKLGGFQPGSLVLIAARPSVGKTALCTAIALRMLLDSLGVFFASLEMTRLEVIERMACSLAKVDSHRLRQGLLTDAEVAKLAAAGEDMRQCPLRIDDGGRQTVLRIASRARKMKRQKGLAAVFIDYLQLVSPASRAKQRYEQVGEISRQLKATAKELNVPIVAACQLNRASEDRTDKRPRLSDLRESGSLEMDADVVVLLHRSQEERNVIELDLSKNRSGPVGVVKLLYQPQWTRFENYFGMPIGD